MLTAIFMIDLPSDCRHDARIIENNACCNFPECKVTSSIALCCSTIDCKSRWMTCLHFLKLSRYSVPGTNAANLCIWILDSSDQENS